MTVLMGKTIRELALENPSSTKVFESLGIDYCCARNRSLSEACRVANLSMDKVIDWLNQADLADVARLHQRDWQIEPLSSLVAHIKSTHHQYAREEIVRLGPLFEKVCSVHSKKHPELLETRETFRGLAAELSAHMVKEETMLFPYIVRMEAAVASQEMIVRAPFGSVQDRVSMMEHEHDSAGNALRAMRQTTNGYSAPAASCASYQTLYKALAAFERDLHQHIHLENNILFPRAIALEKEL